MEKEELNYIEAVTLGQAINITVQVKTAKKEDISFDSIKEEVFTHYYPMLCKMKEEMIYRKNKLKEYHDQLVNEQQKKSIDNQMDDIM